MIIKWFNISFDIFGRTSTENPKIDKDWNQTKISQEIFTDLVNNGHIYDKEVEQLYSPELGKFLADRYITGGCPKCNADNAFGDQCEKCGSALSPIELINPKSTLSGKVPELKKTTILFESHDLYSEGIGNRIINRFKITHKIKYFIHLD